MDLKNDNESGKDEMNNPSKIPLYAARRMTLARRGSQMVGLGSLIATMEKKAETPRNKSTFALANNRRLTQSMSTAGFILNQPPPSNIRPGFDVKKMWKKAKSIFNTVSKLRRVQNEVEVFGTRDQAGNDAKESKQVEKGITLFNEQQEHHASWFIILPDSTVKLTWNVILAVMLLYTALVMPVRIFFFDTPSLGWTIIERTIDALFWLDMLINFISAYVDENDNVVTDIKLIIKKYITGWFFFDLIACFPFELFTNSAGSILGQYNAVLRLLRLPRLYRLVKVGKLFGALRLMSGGGVLDYGDLFIYNASTRYIHNSTFRLGKTVCLCTHNVYFRTLVRLRVVCLGKIQWVYHRYLGCTCRNTGSIFRYSLHILSLLGCHHNVYYRIW